MIDKQTTRPRRKRFADALPAVVLVLVAAGPTAAADNAMTPLGLSEVKVGGEIGRRIDVTINNNLLVLDAEKDFLQPFVQRNRRSGYIGLGKLIDATVRFAAHSGDQRVHALKRRLIDHVVANQCPDGYLGMIAEDARMWGMWDVHEMAYLIFALISDYELFGEKRSLETARRAADYIVARWPGKPDDWDARTGVATHVSVTGLERAMIHLGRHTDEPSYLQFCLGPRRLADWDLDIVIGRRPLIEGHIYAYLCRCLAQLELYRSMPEARLQRQSEQAATFLTCDDGMAVTGGCGQWEIWTDDQDSREALAETCATAYLVRWFDSLLRLHGSAHYGDLMERTIYNSLFAAQSPDGRQIRYYSPMEGNRVYHPGDSYCCPCNYRRIIAELPAMIYYRDAEGVVVNLYSESEAKIQLGAGVVIRQETDYPNSGRVRLQVEPQQPMEFCLRLRIPAWCAAATISVNEQAAQEVSGGGFVRLQRTWRSGDCVRLQMPMTWRLVAGRKRQSGRVAVMRGPMVFCLNPVQDDQLAKLDGAALGRITLDPDSLGEPLADDSVRLAGMACAVQAWKPGYAVKRPGDLKLRLSEFADPAGTATYFRLQDMSVAVDDELLSGTASQGSR